MGSLIYLDNAATSHPKPEPVYRAVDQCLRALAGNPGRGAHRAAGAAAMQIERTRGALARLFGGDAPDRLVFAANGTDALNLAIKGCLRDGDHVVTTTLEHNSVVRPLHRLEQQGRIRVDRVAPGADGVIDPDAVRHAVRPDTRLVVVTHASNVLGTVQPVAAIGAHLQTTDTLFLVDAAQSAGVIPIDVGRAGIDLLAFTGHKALLGPVGIGGLYLSKRARLETWREGGTGTASADPDHPRDLPARLEAGTPNTAGIAGLEAAIAFLAVEGVEAIGRRESGLRRRLAERLAADERIRVHAAAADPAVGTLSVTVAGYDPNEVGAILDQNFGIAVRTGLHCAPGAHRHLDTFPAGTVRFSVGCFTREADVDAAAAALLEIAAGSGS